jgi:hypothetical protein
MNIDAEARLEIRNKRFREICLFHNHLAMVWAEKMAAGEDTPMYNVKVERLMHRLTARILSGLDWPKAREKRAAIASEFAYTSLLASGGTPSSLA